MENFNIIHTYIFKTQFFYFVKSLTSYNDFTFILYMYNIFLLRYAFVS